MLTKKEVLVLFDKAVRLPRCLQCRTIVQFIDLSDNRMSPEKFAYKINYTCSIFKERKSVTFYPYTVGIQGASKLKGTNLK